MKKVTITSEMKSFTEQDGNGHEPNNSNSSKPNIQFIENTPFATVEKNGKFVVIFGNHMIDPKEYDTHEAAVKAIYKTNWIQILNVVGIYLDTVLSSRETK